MSQKTETVEKPAEELTEDRRFLHCFCMICNWNREIAVSMCGAKARPVVELAAQRPKGDLCVVCDELSVLPCEGCGF